MIAASGKIGTGGTGLTLTGDTDTVAGNSSGSRRATALPNAVGISLHTTNTTIGGTAAAPATSSRATPATGSTSTATPGNTLQGNTIGTWRRDARQRRHGINVILPAPDGTTATTRIALDDTIGGTGTGPNIIAGNAGAGVAVTNNGASTPA